MSADTVVSDPVNPQAFNRYTYCLNNPLRYVDPSGHYGEGLSSGYKEGALGWTLADEWLIWQGGQWIPINSPEDPTPRVNDEWKWDDPAATAAFGIAIALLADDASGAGIIDDPLAAIAALVGLGITVGANWDYIEDKISDALNVVFSSSEGEIIDDFNNNPNNWEKTEEKSEPATGKKYKGSTSVEETYRNKQTGQVLERHRIFGPSGKLIHDHFRVK